MLTSWRIWRLAWIRSSRRTRPSRTTVIRRMTWSQSIDASGKMTRSHEEFVRSRSSQRVLFWSAGSTEDRMTRARPEICSLRIGLRLCGMVDEPTCLAPNASSTSAISVLWSDRTSIAILSSVVATFARKKKYSAYRSRWITWFETSTGDRSSSAIIRAWISGAPGPSAACVPTAPVSWPTSTRGRSSARRSRWRSTSAAQMAKRRP